MIGLQGESCSDLLDETLENGDEIEILNTPPN